MRIPALALFIRQLRLDARASRTYLTRAILVGGVLLGLMAAHAASALVAAPGLDFFRTLVFINFFFVSMAGLSYFASVIAEEKEEMTLGLLRMTGLSPV